MKKYNFMIQTSIMVEAADDDAARAIARALKVAMNDADVTVTEDETNRLIGD